jgi:D-amino peptidase
MRGLPDVCRENIISVLYEGFENLKAVKPYKPNGPTTITIELATADRADEFRNRHGVEIVEPLKVVSRGKDWLEAWNQIWHWRV